LAVSGLKQPSAVGLAKFGLQPSALMGGQLANGADAMAVTSTGGATALHFAAGHGNAESVRALLDKKVPVDVRETAWGQTPLMWAAAYNRVAAIDVLIKAGAGAMHIEDQVGAKRCGHRPGKEIVGQDEMVDRIKAAVDGRTDASFFIMARTDSLAVEGFDRAVERAIACVEAGADGIFPEALTELSMFEKFSKAVGVPILANITEFGQTPLFTLEQLAGAGVAIALYPLSAFRAANKAAENVYRAIRTEGTQASVVRTMQTRQELYDTIGYWDFERKLDQLFAAKK
jgi:methylisocitrate lyase